MAYIYQITNDINGKIYVGKTVKNNIQERWKEHLKDYKKSRCEKRPLYDAMNKYGPENFSIKELEECSLEELNDKEIYWIEKLDSFRYGYNATAGGDGKQTADYDLIIKYYNLYHNIAEVHRQLGYDYETIKSALLNKNITIISSAEISLITQGKKIKQYDLNNNYLQSFNSCGQAAKYLIDNHYTTSLKTSLVSGHIGQVCNNKRKTAYGFKWKYE